MEDINFSPSIKDMNAPLIQNTFLPELFKGETIAYEYHDTRGKWKWGLGIVEDQPIPRVTKIQVWKRKEREFHELTADEQKKSNELTGRLKRHTEAILAEKKELEEKARRIVEKENAMEYRRSMAQKKGDIVAAKLERARNAVRKIDNAEIHEMRSYRKVPDGVKLVLSAVLIALGDENEGPSSKASRCRQSLGGVTDVAPKYRSNIRGKGGVIPWEVILARIRDTDFFEVVANFEAKNMSEENFQLLKTRFMTNPDFTYKNIEKASRAAGPLFMWIMAHISTISYNNENNEVNKKIEKINNEMGKIEEQSAFIRMKIKDLEDEIQKIDDEKNELLEGVDFLEDESLLATTLSSVQNYRQANKTEWTQTDEYKYILTTSVLTNLDNGCEMNSNGNSRIKVDLSVATNVQQMIQTSRRGAAATDLAEYSLASSRTSRTPGRTPGRTTVVTSGGVADVLNKLLKEAQTEIQCLRAELAEEKEARAVAQNAAYDFEANYYLIQMDFEAMKSAADAANANIDTLRAELAAEREARTIPLKTMSDVINVNLEEELKSMHGAADDAQAVREWQHEMTPRVEFRVNELRAQLEAAKEETAKTEYERLAKELSEFRSKLGDAEAELNDKKDVISRAEIDALKAELTANMKSKLVASEDESTETSKNTYVNSQAEMDTLRTELAALKTELAIEKEARAVAQKAADDFEANYYHIQMDLESMKSAADAVKCENAVRDAQSAYDYNMGEGSLARSATVEPQHNIETLAEVHISESNCLHNNDELRDRLARIARRALKGLGRDVDEVIGVREQYQ